VTATSQSGISKTSSAISLSSMPTVNQISTTTFTVSAPSSGLSSGEIGAIVGSIVAVIAISIIIGGSICCFRARRKDRESGTPDIDVPPHIEMSDMAPELLSYSENANRDMPSGMLRHPENTKGDMPSGMLRYPENAKSDVPSGMLRYPDAEIQDSGRLENPD
jgi:hypothetical protein